LNISSTPTQTAAEIAAAAEAAAKAAAQAAAEARAAEIAVAQTKLATVLKGDKAGTIGEYAAANVYISTAASLARINAEVLKLSANDRSDFTKIKVIADKIEFDESFFNATARPTLSTYARYEVVGITERILPTVNTKVLELPAAVRVDTKAIQEIIKVESFVDLVANTQTRGGVSSQSLIQRGLLPADTPYKHSVRSGLGSYPEGSLNSMEKIEAAIKEQIYKAEAPKRRLAEIKAKIAARNK
jgi:multidrug efflux pump subunit AcrA (membrane-fusion protein)